MRISSRFGSALLAMTAAVFPAAAQTTAANVYVQTNLVGNTKGLAPVVDPNLVDPWGVSISASSPFWISNHLSATSTLYNGSGVANSTIVKIPAGAASAAGAIGRPTGQVQNNLSTSVTPVAGTTYTFKTANNSGDPAFNQLLGVNNSGTIVGYFGDGTVQPNMGYTLTVPATFTNENYPNSAQTQVIGINNSGTGAPPITVGFWVDANGNNFGFTNVGGTFTSVMSPNTPSSGTTTNQLLGVNDSGIAVGFYVDGNDTAHGYQYNIATKTFTPVSLPASFNAGATTAADINNSGTIAGFFVDTAGNQHGFFGSGTTFTQLDNPNGSNTAAFGLNNLGEVVGTYSDANDETQGFIYFIATKSWQTISVPAASANAAFGVTGTTINGINDVGTLVGFYSDGNNVNGFYATTSLPTPFLLPSPNGKTASFIFDTDDGTISAWNGSVVASTAVITADNSAAKAVYKGLAIGSSVAGPTIYAANFYSGKIEAYNGLWQPVTLTGSFTDPSVPTGFAPFNIWNLGGKLYVTYAMQNAAKFLDVAGAGNGYVAVFDLNGNLITHLVSGGVLNSPWGVAIAPTNWGAFGGALLVGNFGDGKINAFNATTGAPLGTLMSPAGSPIVNAGLWALIFGNGKSGGDTNTLYFTAGVPNGTTAPRGLLGAIAPPLAITAIYNAASELTGNIAPGELVLIEGQSVGPSPSVTNAIPATGSMPTSVNASTPVNTTSVTFNGTPAPIIYSGSGGTAVQVPYEIAGSTSANVVMNVGSQTAQFTAPVAPTAPGLFTVDLSGKNSLVAMNSDGTLNSASNPAARGSKITLFATGEGVTNPADMDGVVETGSGDVPVTSMGVTIGGLGVVMPTAASLPKDVSGVLQLTVTVPANLFSTGQMPVVLVAGGVLATQPTFIYVK